MDQTIDCSPDGMRILFSTPYFGTPKSSNVFSVRTDGSGLVQLTRSHGAQSTMAPPRLVAGRDEDRLHEEPARPLPPLRDERGRHGRDSGHPRLGVLGGLGQAWVTIGPLLSACWCGVVSMASKPSSRATCGSRQSSRRED